MHLFQSKGVRIPVLRCLLAWQDTSLCGIRWPLHSSSSTSSSSGDALRSLTGNGVPGNELINDSGTVVTPCYNKGDTGEERRAKERQQERKRERAAEEAAAAAEEAAEEAAEREQAVRARAAARKRTLLVSDFGDKLKGFKAHESLKEEGSEEEGGSGEEEEGGEDGEDGKDGEGKGGKGEDGKGKGRGVERYKETTGSTNGTINGTVNSNSTIGALGFDMEEEEDDSRGGRPTLPNGTMVDGEASVVRASRALLGCWEGK